MKTGRSLQELAAEIERQSESKRDLLVNLGALSMSTDNSGVQLNVDYGGDGGNKSFQFEQFGMNEIAHRQVGQHLRIPAAYYDRMRTDYPDLLVENVNGWFSRTPNTSRMLRTLDGTARAFLSDRYRRIDNIEVAQTVLPIIANMGGANVESCELTDGRMYIKVVNPKIQTEVVKGDVVQSGLIITNSEVGLGSLSVSPLIFRLVCSNGMIARDETVRKYHVGRLNETGGDYDIYRNETIEADDRAYLMKLEDTVRAAVSEAKFMSIVDRMRETTEAKIEAPAVPKVVELTSKEYDFNEDEQKGILGHLIAGNDLSLYGLANAVTRQAQDVESYDRSTDLEAAGWKIITMAPSLWKRIAAESR
ncbi:MAG: DUF932 domain-containing protein [Oscillospiraceae bacterium]